MEVIHIGDTDPVYIALDLVDRQYVCSQWSNGAHVIICECGNMYFQYLAQMKYKNRVKIHWIGFAKLLNILRSADEKPQGIAVVVDSQHSGFTLKYSKLNMIHSYGTN